MPSSPSPVPALPIYQGKPQRRIPGTDAVAVTMYRSTDGSVREVAVFSASAGVLGTVHYQSPTRGRLGGYTLQAVPSFCDERWPTLAAYVAEMTRRLGGV